MRQTLDRLVADGETVYPRQLSELLDEANALADAAGALPDAPLRAIQ